MKHIMKRILRYLGLALAVLFVLWVISIAVVYFMVDAEKIRKFAITTVNENTKGELDIGEIKLKIFPLVYFKIKELTFRSSPEFEKKEMFSCKDTELSFNPFTLIVGRPSITLHLDNPSFNVSDMFKTEKKSKSPDVLRYLFISKLVFNVDDADLVYETPKKDAYGIKGLSLDLEIDPVSRKISIQIDAPINYKKADTIIKGDIAMTADVKVVDKDKVEVEAVVDAGKLSITTKSLIKKEGDVLEATISAETDLKNKIVIKDMTLTLIDEFLKISGSVSDLKMQYPQFSINMYPSSTFDISNFENLMPALKDYGLSGKLKGTIGVSGPANNINIKMDIDASDTAVSSKFFAKEKGAMLKSSLNANTDLKYLGIRSLQVYFKDDKNNLKLNVSNTKRSKKLIIADIYSSYLDVISCLPKKKNEKNPQTKEAKADASSAKDASFNEDMPVVKKEDIEMIKKSLADYSIKLNTTIDKLIYKELEINNFIMEGSFSKDELSINKMNLGLLKGNVAGNFKMGLDLDRPNYKGKLDFEDVKVKDAAGIFMPNIKGVINGTVSTSIDFTASGYSMKSIKNSLTGRDKFEVNNFEYTAEELSAVINDNLKNNLDKLMPGWSGENKVLGSNPGWETVQGTFNIKDGKINIEQFLAKQGEYEATGKGEITFNGHMNMFLEVVVPFKNIPYEPLRVGVGKEKAMIPLHLSGPLMKPELDTASLVAYLTGKTITFVPERLGTAVLHAPESLKQDVQKAGERLKNTFKAIGF